MRTVVLIAVPLILVVVGLYIAALPPDEGPPPRSDDPLDRVDPPLVPDRAAESDGGEREETPFVVTVRDPATGKPVPGAKAVLMGKGFRKEGITDSEGRVELRVPAGQVRIRVSGEGRATTQVDTEAAAGGTVRPFDLPLGATLAGRVVEKGTGRPIVGAHIRGFMGRKEAHTDSDGRYRMEGPGSGKWNVHAYHPEALPAHAEIKIDASKKETRLDLELPGGAWVSATVEAPAGPLRFQAWVEQGGQPRPRTLDTRYGYPARSSSGKLEDEAPVQPGHGVRLGPLSAGTHRVRARALLPVPGTNEIVRIDKEEKVVLPEEGRAAVTFQFTVEEIESARKR